MLRHKTEAAGLSVDRYGYAKVDELIEAVNRDGRYYLDRQILNEIVQTDSKKRYMWNDDQTKIRACQGHSFPVDLALAPKRPPDLLYHGTAERFLDSILQMGLKKGARMYVHHSPDTETAVKVGERHGRPVVLTVNSGQMHTDGFTFYQADNGVWLTDYVPVEYLEVISSAKIYE